MIEDAAISRIDAPVEDTSAQPNCPSCGYTKEDAGLNMDHHLCNNAGNAPWENPNPAKPLEVEDTAVELLKHTCPRCAGATTTATTSFVDPSKTKPQSCYLCHGTGRIDIPFDDLKTLYLAEKARTRELEKWKVEAERLLQRVYDVKGYAEIAAFIPQGSGEV